MRPLEDRFWEKVQKGDGCWLWTGATTKGCGVIGVRRNSINQDRRKMEYASRVSYRLHYGEIPPKMEVGHRCDTPLCVRPDHLFLCTHAENVADMDRKRRRKHPRLKLSPETVAAIRLSTEADRDIAERLHVPLGCVRLARSGATWKMVNIPPRRLPAGGPRAAFDHAAAISFREAGRSIDWIAKELHVGYGTLQRFFSLQKNGGLLAQAPKDEAARNYLITNAS